MENKDKIIDGLFEVIQTKKEEIKRIEKPEWKTNCSYAIEGSRVDSRVNIRVLHIDEVVDCVTQLLQIQDYRIKATDILEVPTRKYQGFNIEDWISDFKTRASIINVASKKKELEKLEGRLDKLVSKEKREQMELEAIQKELGL